MECSEIKELLPLYLSGGLEKSKHQLLENHMAACPDCQAEFAEIKRLWDLMGEIPVPEPSPTMQMEFNAILRNFKEEHAPRPNLISAWIEKFREQWQLQLRPHFAISIVMIAFGFFLGFFLNRPEPITLANHKQIDSLSSQILEMKQVMMLTLLQDPSASQRILAVGYTENIDQVSNKIIDALFTTLNGDPNVNVRLVTLEALLKYSNMPKVREGLVKSLAVQDSPLLQTAIADIMVKLQEKRSVETMRKLLQNKNLNDMVKVKIEESINKLI